MAFLLAGVLSSGPISGFASGTTADKLTSTASTWTTNQWRGEGIYIDSGTNAGQHRIIASNTTDVLRFEFWGGSQPSTLSTFQVMRSIKALPGSVERDTVEIGDRHRAFDGTYRSSVRARKDTWRLRTIGLSLADASTVKSTITASTQPIRCVGDLVSDTGGAVNCDIELERREYFHVSTGDRVSLQMTLHESS